MNSQSNYENMYFNNTVNTIPANHFPVVFPLHWHRYTEIMYYPDNAKCDYSPVIAINQVQYTLHPGDILFIWPGELHETISNPHQVLYGIQFPATLIQDVTDFASYQQLFRTLHLISKEKNADFSQNLQLHLNHIFFLSQNRDAFCGVHSLISLYEFFMEFCRYLNQAPHAKDSSKLSDSDRSMTRIRRTCSYIADNCTKPLTLPAVSDYAGFSSCYFSRIFKQTTSYSFVEYLSLQRVKYAQNLLADSDLPITEVAYQSGFRSISTFNRAFLTYSGCSPSEYRHYYVH